MNSPRDASLVSQGYSLRCSRRAIPGTCSRGFLGCSVQSGLSFGVHRLFRGLVPLLFSPRMGRGTRLLRKGSVRSRCPRLSLQYLFTRSGSAWRRGMLFPGLSRFIFALSAFSRAFFGPALFRWRQGDAGAPGFAQANRNRLLWGPCSMFSFADMFNLFVDKFSSCRRWRFALLKISFSAV